MDDRKITKETQKVTVELSDRTRWEGEVFLRLHDAHHTGRQKIGDLLNQRLSFVPIKTGGRTVLLNISQIRTVRTDRDQEHDELMTLGKKYPIRILTTGGENLQGDFYINIPEETGRIKDYLNQQLRFFPLFQNTTILYVNRDFILSIQD